MVSYIPIALVKARLELLSFVSQCLHKRSEHRMYNTARVLRRELMPQRVFHNASTYKCILPYFSSNNVGVERFELPVRLSSRFQSESAPNYRFRPRNFCVLSSAVIRSVIHKHRLVGTAKSPQIPAKTNIRLARIVPPVQIMSQQPCLDKRYESPPNAGCSCRRCRPPHKRRHQAAQRHLHP